MTELAAMRELIGLPAPEDDFDGSVLNLVDSLGFVQLLERMEVRLGVSIDISGVELGQIVNIDRLASFLTNLLRDADDIRIDPVGSRPSGAPRAALMRLACDLRLDQINASGQRRLDARAVESLSSRRTAFEWSHMGFSCITMGEVRDSIRGAPHVSPLRSGHIGDWTPIVDGIAGAIDYNHILCAQEHLAHPHVFELNATETGDLKHGDWIYLPGSRVRSGARQVLELFSWDGSRFAQRNRDIALLTPFVLAATTDGLVPLVTLHREVQRAHPSWRFQSESQLVLRSRSLLRTIAEALFERAFNDPTFAVTLDDFVDRVVFVDGRTERLSSWTTSANALRAGDVEFATASQFADSIELPFLAAADPSALMTQPKEFDRPMLLASTSLMGFLLAALRTHLQRPEQELDPFTLHLHWGAIGMAGHPPTKHGYFRDHIKRTRRVARFVAAAAPELPSVFFCLLPAAPYLVWPRDAYPDDLGHIDELIRSALRLTTPLHDRVGDMVTVMNRLVEHWYENRARTISEYLRNRFSRRRSLFADTAPPPPGRFLKPSEFDSLSFVQATVLVGSLMEIAGRVEP